MASTTTRPSTSYYRYAFLLISLLLTLHSVIISTSQLGANYKYNEAAGEGDDDDYQRRLDIMMGRRAPFDEHVGDNRIDGGLVDDGDVSGSNDDDDEEEEEKRVEETTNRRSDRFASRFNEMTTTNDVTTDSIISSQLSSATAASSSTLPKEEDASLSLTSNKQRKAEKQYAAELLREKVRPRRNPTGYRFRGWYHPDEFNFWLSDEHQQQQEHQPEEYQPEEEDDEQQGEGKDESLDKRSNGNNNNSNSNTRAWWRNNSRCFEVDYICHRQRTNQWMYMTSFPPPMEGQEQEQQRSEKIFQPTMELKPGPSKYDGGRYNAELRVNIKVSSPTLLQKQQQQQQQQQYQGEEGSNNKVSFDQCQLSKTPTHIVLQSLFNDMVGEFYSRSLLGLHQTMMMDVDDNNINNEVYNDDANDDATINSTITASSSTTTTPLPWEEDIQFYIHIPLKGKKVLDGHKLLTAGMLSNPNVGIPMSFLDLFTQLEEEGVEQEEKEKEEEKGNKSNDDCQCYRRMVFCGYDVYTHNEDVDSSDVDFVEHYDKRLNRERDKEAAEEAGSDDEVGDEEEEEEEEENDDKKLYQGAVADTSETTSSPPSVPTYNPHLKYTLWSSGTISDNDAQPDCVKGEGCQGYANLRKFLSSNFVKHYPKLGDDIVKFRRSALMAKDLISDDYSGDTKEWVVVGLTQRTYRRVWLNLHSVMERCNTQFNNRRVVCIEVNVEETSSPYEQLLLHRSLDVMIGVHGAQLTQAVVLPPHAHVLEILPWVPNYIRGHWVARREAPTPMGINYHNTDLNHAGYSLDRSSTDLCVGVGEVGSEEEKKCFLSRRKIFIWDNRDFNVEPEVIIQYLDKLVLFMRDDEMGTICSELKDRLDDRFVLYNVWCADEGESTLSVSHYYAGGSEEDKSNFGLGKRERRRKGLKHE